MSGKVRKRKIKPCLPTTAGQWLCAHSPKKKNQHEINKQTCFKKINDFDASNPPYPNTGRSPEPQVDRCKDEVVKKMKHRFLPPSIIPRRNIFTRGSLFQKRIFKLKKEEPSSSHSSLYPPSPLVFTEDLIFSNFDWGVRSSDVFSPPSTI